MNRRKMAQDFRCLKIKNMYLYMYKKSLAFITFCLVGIMAGGQITDENILLPAHPRLLLLAGTEKAIAANTRKNLLLSNVHNNILHVCDKILFQPPVQRVKIGIRLLDKSRTCLLRVFYLSYAYRMTKNEKYFLRAEQELLAAAAFTDWNPSVFLDVSEMTMALSIGYDWLYDKLSPSSRMLIKEAILKKGIEPSLDSANNWWLKSKGNWNQVCNAGMTYGAIATYEEHPVLSQQIINRAIQTVALPMHEYAPDGNYPEGYMYWEYGTSFNVMLIAALQTAFGSDFGLADKPGFMQTPVFLRNLSGTSGKPFNYADCISSTQFNPAVFWFAAHSKNPNLLWVEKQSLLKNDSVLNRLLPGTMIWGSGIDLKKIAAPINKVWIGGGVNPVALLRTSWTKPDAIYVGFKGGSPSNNHGHMDVGSFVMDAGGERWAMDFGMQDYESLESKGLGIWNMAQNSDRWKVFRYNNFAHNTLTINNSLQQVKGAAAITDYSSNPKFLNAVSDITKVYDSLVAKAVRGVAIVDEKYVVVKDEIQTKESAVTIRWSMATPATVNILNDSIAELTQHGKKLFLKTKLPVSAKLTTWSTTPATAWDAPNPGTVIIGFEIKLAPNQNHTISVVLVPEKNKRIANDTILPLNQWPKDKPLHTNQTARKQ